VTDERASHGELIDHLLRTSLAQRQALAANLSDLSVLVRETVEELCKEADHAPWTSASALCPAVVGDAVLLGRCSSTCSPTHSSSHATRRAADRSQLPQQNNETIFFVRDNGAGFNMQTPTSSSGFQRLHGNAEFRRHRHRPVAGTANISATADASGPRLSPGNGALFEFTLSA